MACPVSKSCDEIGLFVRVRAQVRRRKPRKNPRGRARLRSRKRGFGVCQKREFRRRSCKPMWTMFAGTGTIAGRSSPVEPVSSPTPSLPTLLTPWISSTKPRAVILGTAISLKPPLSPQTTPVSSSLSNWLLKLNDLFLMFCFLWICSFQATMGVLTPVEVPE